MGRLEKQIIVGAIALVAILLGIVVLTGVKPVKAGDEGHAKPEWMPPEVPLTMSEPGHESSEEGADLGLGGSELSLGSDPKPADVPGKQPETERQVLAGSPATQEASENSGRPLRLDAVDELRRYEVKKGETMGEIAMRELGSVNDLDLILEVNEGMRADRVRAGDEIWLPSKAAADQRRSEKQAAASAQVKPEVERAAPTTGRSHEVGSGDSLWRIAERYYGREGAGDGVKRIVVANSKLTDENTVLRLGWVLSIPE